MGVLSAASDWACGGSAPARLASSSRRLCGRFGRRQTRFGWWRCLFALFAAAIFARGSRRVVKGNCIDEDRGCHGHPQSFGSGFAWWYVVCWAWNVLVVIVKDEGWPHYFRTWLVVAIVYGVYWHPQNGGDDGGRRGRVGVRQVPHSWVQRVPQILVRRVPQTLVRRVPQILVRRVPQLWVGRVPQIFGPARSPAFVPT
jgi:hypothetical protein